MNIGLDLDGVVYPWHASFYRYFQEYRGYEGTQREFWVYMRSLPKEVQDYYVSLPMTYTDTTPTTDVLTYLPLIAELGTVYYITARPEEVKWATRKFFDYFDLPFKENVIFSKDKATYVRLLGLDFFLDDLSHNVTVLESLTDAYLFRAVHNWEDREKHKVINSFKEFYELLRSKNENKRPGISFSRPVSNSNDT